MLLRPRLQLSQLPPLSCPADAIWARSCARPRLLADLMHAKLSSLAISAETAAVVQTMRFLQMQRLQGGGG